MEPSTKTTEELFRELCEIVKELGWSIAIPGANPEENISGLVVGSQKYIEDVLDGKFADSQPEVIETETRKDEND